MGTAMRARLLLLTGAICALAVPAYADDAVVHGASAPVVSYAALDSLPDWRGIWTPNFSPMGTAAQPPDLKGDYQKRYAAFKANPAGAPPKASNCAVPGMPMVMTMPYDIEILINPGRVTIIQEAYMQVRRVFTDGRPLPDDPDPTFNGSSIGHWEGNTLVVETVGIRPEVPMGMGVSHSDALKIVERIHLASDNPDKLVDEMSFEDKNALKKPWQQTLTYARHREWDQLEFICNENDRNPVGQDGKTEFLLRDESTPATPPAPKAP
jgi:hypothetical protein